eukprot:jgi/Galph1/104/GphlegSOOS_G4817.1
MDREYRNTQDILREIEKDVASLCDYIDSHNPEASLNSFVFSTLTELWCVKTPFPEEGKSIFLQSTGKLWPFRGWWSRPESLSPPIVPSPLPKRFIISSVVSCFHSCSRNPSNLCIILTGRLASLKLQVSRILMELGLELNPCFLFCKPAGDTYMDTVAYKSLVIEGIAKRLPGIRRCVIYEDRSPHVELFKHSLAPRMKSRFSIKTSLFRIRGDNIEPQDDL